MNAETVSQKKFFWRLFGKKLSAKHFKKDDFFEVFELQIISMFHDSLYHDLKKVRCKILIGPLVLLKMSFMWQAAISHAYASLQTVMCDISITKLSSSHTFFHLFSLDLDSDMFFAGKEF